MPLRTVRRIHDAVRDDIADLVTRRAMPTASIDHIDPFLFLNHHGPQNYPSPNRGLPFGPHPHRGFETVTFIVEGDIAHSDTGGHESVIEAGGVQWMTAGSGLVHMESSSANFKKRGGAMECLQLWVNLPARLKMTAPRYTGLQRQHIPEITSEGTTVRAISGDWGDAKPAMQPLYDIAIAEVWFDAGATRTFTIAAGRNIFFYVARGSVEVNGRDAHQFQLAEFESEGNEGDEIAVTAQSAAMILLGHAIPFLEPIVAHGPFVMNTRAEIVAAVEDYQQGKFGLPQDLSPA
jgi:redox-sensitive bicupin YhaK (pirin superfamily)